MFVWDSYPPDYRSPEVSRITVAVGSGESVAVVGLSGSGKSNLLGFLAHRLGRDGFLPGVVSPHPAFYLVDCNRLAETSAEGLYRLALEAMGHSAEKANYSMLDESIRRTLEQTPGVCLLLDRYDALGLVEKQGAGIASSLRALRDTHKYELTFVTSSRQLPDSQDELAELFYAHTLWLGPMNESDSRWNIERYARRKGREWDMSTVQRILQLSGGYPSLLRAVCEACAEGCPLELKSIRQHPAVQQRIDEFWSDQPSQADLEASGLREHPLLSYGRPVEAIHDSQLTAKENQLWAYFKAHPNQVCEKDDLIQAIWPEDVIFERGVRDDSLAQLVRRLREKIEPFPSSPKHIHTVLGRGYRFTP